MKSWQDLSLLKLNLKQKEKLNFPALRHSSNCTDVMNVHVHDVCMCIYVYNDFKLFIGNIRLEPERVTSVSPRINFKDRGVRQSVLHDIWSTKFNLSYKTGLFSINFMGGNTVVTVLML